MSEALKEAGVASATAEERLRSLAAAAVRLHPRNFDAAKDALFAEVRGNAALLWELFSPFRSQAAHRILSDAFAEMNKRDRPAPETAAGGGLGHIARDNQGRLAQPADTTESAEGLVIIGDRNSRAPRASAAAGASAVRAVERRSLLDTMRVNGKPLGDVTPGEAREWAATREKSARRDRRFIVALTANLPDGDPIRKYRTPEDAQAIFENIETGNAE